MANVIELIIADHREVDDLFARLRSGRGDRSALAAELERLLLAHSRAEEDRVYPVVVRQGSDEKAEIQHSEEEHHEAEELARRLREADPTLKRFDDLVERLAESVTHHVRTEESEVLPALREAASAAELSELADQFTRRKEEILQRFGQDGQSADEASREELYRDAQDAGVPRRSQMNKDELAQAMQRPEHGGA